MCSLLFISGVLLPIAFNEQLVNGRGDHKVNLGEHKNGYVNDTRDLLKWHTSKFIEICQHCQARRIHYHGSLGATLRVFLHVISIILTWIQQFLCALILLFRILLMLHSLMRFDECQPLSPIRQILGIHSGKINGQIEKEIGQQLTCDTCCVLMHK